MNACAPFDYTKLIQIRSYNVHPYVEEAIIQRIAEAINRAHKPIIIWVAESSLLEHLHCL